MTDGIYKDRLHIVSNDPLHPAVDIPLQLTVVGKYDTRHADTVAYGKVVAGLNSDGVAQVYTQPFTISNEGSKTVTINSAELSSAHLAFASEITFPLVVAPGEVFKTDILFTPDSTLTAFNETLTLNTDQQSQETVRIPVTANVVLPPVIALDSSAIKIVMQQNDTAQRSITIANNGKSDLEYNISVLYRRPGITYTGVSKPIVIGDKGKKKNSSITLQGAANPITIMGVNETFVDSLITPVPGNDFIEYMGFGDDSYPIVSATRFVTGDKPFNLSHIGNLYRTNSTNAITAKLRIRLGTDINSTVAVREQAVTLEADTLGKYAIVKLDSSLQLYPHEVFWVEWEYSTGTRFPQGVQFVPNGDRMDGSFYFKSVGEASFRLEYAAWRYFVNAYAQQDSLKAGWLSLSPVSATVNKDKSQKLNITVNGPLVPPAEESADVIIQSNDVLNPETKLRINVRIDQAPYLTKHDSLQVNEGDTLTYLIPAKDAEGSDITIVSTDSVNISIDKKDSLNYFVYAPAFTDSGWHHFEIELSDVYNNKRKDTLLVKVLNVNRAPLVSKHLDTLTLYVQSPAYQLALDTIFNDPDADTLQYKFAGDTTTLADVYVDRSGLLSIIPKDTGSVQLRFTATDPFAETAADTLFLIIRRNTPPIATALPNIVIEAGAAARKLNLNNWFSDADSTDILSYTATIDSAALATASVADSTLSLTGISGGNTIVHVTASDGNGGTVESSFLLTVLNNKGTIVNDYHITVAPNPVRSVANIRFQLGTDKKVRIDLIGMNGKLQAVLFDGNKMAGNQIIQANLSSLAAGNYLVRFTIDGKMGIVQIAKL